MRRKKEERNEREKRTLLGYVTNEVKGANEDNSKLEHVITPKTHTHIDIFICISVERRKRDAREIPKWKQIPRTLLYF